MISFNSPAEFARYLMRAATEVPRAQARGLGQAAEAMLLEARNIIGHYQEQAGQFPRWKDLADTTLYGFHDHTGQYHPGKIELGYASESEHNPLLRTGELRDSITSYHDGMHAGVGSDSDVAVDQEMGTRTIPARSFLGRAVYVTSPDGVQYVLAAVIDVIAGPGSGSSIRRTLGTEGSEDIPF